MYMDHKLVTAAEVVRKFYGFPFEVTPIRNGKSKCRPRSLPLGSRTLRIIDGYWWRICGYASQAYEWAEDRSQ